MWAMQRAFEMVIVADKGPEDVDTVVDSNGLYGMFVEKGHLGLDYILIEMASDNYVGQGQSYVS